MPPPSAHFSTDQDSTELIELISEDVAGNSHGKSLVSEKSNRIATIKVKVESKGQGEGRPFSFRPDITEITDISQPHVNGITSGTWDEDISVCIPELELKDIQSMLLLSWILLVYRNTEKNQHSHYSFNDVAASVNETLHDNEEKISKTLLRVREYLDNSILSPKSNGMIMSTIATENDVSSQVCQPR
jgi:hypothetical protein